MPLGRACVQFRAVASSSSSKPWQRSGRREREQRSPHGLKPPLSLQQSPCDPGLLHQKTAVLLSPSRLCHNETRHDCFPRGGISWPSAVRWPLAAWGCLSGQPVSCPTTATGRWVSHVPTTGTAARDCPVSMGVVGNRAPMTGIANQGRPACPRPRTPRSTFAHCLMKEAGRGVLRAC